MAVRLTNLTPTTDHPTVRSLIPRRATYPPTHLCIQGEVKHKYDDTMMGLFAEVFCAMPLCATIDEKVDPCVVLFFESYPAVWPREIPPNPPPDRATATMTPTDQPNGSQQYTPNLQWNRCSSSTGGSPRTTT